MLLLLLWADRLRGQGGEIIVLGRFVSCGEVSSSAHPIIKTKKKLFIIPLLCHILSPPPPSLMGVMWMFAASPLLVCDACCGLSAGTFNSVVEP